MKPIFIEPVAESDAYLPSSKAAEFLGQVLGRPFTRWTLAEWARTKKLPPSLYTKIGSRLYFRAHAILEWLRAGGTRE